MILVINNLKRFGNGIVKHYNNFLCLIKTYFIILKVQLVIMVNKIKNLLINRTLIIILIDD